MQIQQQEASASIDVLVRCLIQEQVSLTEASIRISGLAKTLVLSDVEKEFYLPFDQLALVTSHIPILQEWGKLSAKEQLYFEQERAILEQEHKRRVLSAAQQLMRPQ